MFFIIINYILYSNKIISNINSIDYIIKSQKEFKKIEKYLEFCKKYRFNIKRNKNKIDPKVAIISPIYNRDKYLLRFLKSIQNQSFKNIEIILIDDGSIDKSVKMIEEYKKKDQRIILIKNKINRGTFICRNLGVQYSKAKYVILPDPDDILSKDIINICYKYAKKYDYEIIRFNMYIGNNKITYNNIVNELENRPIYQPELSTYMFYGSKNLKIIDYCINNKFIKKESYLRALNNYYLYLYIIYMEDTIMNYILYRSVKSFFYLKRIGYYYIQHSQSITSNILKQIEYKSKYTYIFLKVVFEYSKNTNFEKEMANFLFISLYNNINIEPKKDFFFYNSIINKYLNNKFIRKDNKDILNNLKLKIIKNKKIL